MVPPSERWVRWREMWEEGVVEGTYILIGTSGDAPPAACINRGWLVEAMEGDVEHWDFACLARDRDGTPWFVAPYDGLCAAVPMDPKAL